MFFMYVALVMLKTLPVQRSRKKYVLVTNECSAQCQQTGHHLHKLNRAPLRALRLHLVLMKFTFDMSQVNAELQQTHYQEPQQIQWLLVINDKEFTEIIESHTFIMQHPPCFRQGWCGSYT
ncbi:Hypothetical predicted protein [Xyrichtys novacula]|uniref:Uncharacterized protein n=1 Tax=Xyrichtys novacula TaxID=13765 RepID=A0AAV1EIW7_XYRNO|nr:Hypothetical predicted protein [Xyrichtys novacula]